MDQLLENILPVGFSLVSAVVAYLMYQYFYGNRHIGAGVHRTFIIGGPSITVLFLGIQSSIPLSLGLLGALSFVRFRTPVKDPAEIGFLLLLIASSVGAATENYVLTGILFAVVFLAMAIQQALGKHLSSQSGNHIIITLDQSAFQDSEDKLNNFLQGNLKYLKLENMSAVEGKVNLHYQYRSSAGFDSLRFTKELRELAQPGQMEIFLN
ncbi:DUF4956 domain-containing protein [Dehalococcoides mccartyi]|uniref:DUF4956 domain-containing protein n=1 Tax=Dehalococcoides mccartyi TaxID=61435 RepID=UPI001A021DAA|nr:DUF4956 domain-containing protein [Dehalococcoides mccartyi]MBF4481746.1 DUF4956 domain-containing protein [Dehalococcoides mccartyi]MBJ7531504.1 DUF4956 domain-containing protein [Dehalococcoides mccartyi]